MSLPTSFFIGRGGGGIDIPITHDPLGDGSGRALYMFEQNLNDQSGTYNASMNAGSANYNSNSAPVGSYYINMESDESVLLNGLIQPETSPWTAMWWWKRANSSGLSTNNRMCDFKENSSSQGTTVSWETDSNWHFILRRSSGGENDSIQINSSSVNDGTWHHICVGASGTGNSQTSFAYVDGVVVTARNSKNRSDSSEQNGILVGTGYGGASAGNFDNWRLFNKALSAAEVSTIYNAEV